VFSPFIHYLSKKLDVLTQIACLDASESGHLKIKRNQSAAAGGRLSG
jgi:hypothetical protein